MPVFSKHRVIVSYCKEARNSQALQPPRGSAEAERLLASATRHPSSPAAAAGPTEAGWELGVSTAWAPPEPACSPAAR